MSLVLASSAPPPPPLIGFLRQRALRCRGWGNDLVDHVVEDAHGHEQQQEVESQAHGVNVHLVYETADPIGTGL